MNKVFTIEKDFVFSPCKVDGEFWSQFHILISYLGRPEDLVALKSANPSEYASVVEPLLRFVTVTENELFERGYIKEQLLEN